MIAQKKVEYPRPINQATHQFALQPKRLNKFVKRRLILLFSVSGIFMIHLLTLLHSHTSTLKEKQEELRVLLERNEVENHKEIQLKQEIRNLNDPEYIGQIARRDYFLSQEGEVIFHIPDIKMTKKD